jgi:hypothetical protein
MKALKVGSVVAFNKLPDAVWFDVISIDGFAIIVREHGTSFAHQRSDKSLIAQIK